MPKGDDVTARRFTFERYLNVRAAYGPSFSPDGRRLCFLSNITGMAEVWSVPVDVHAPVPAWPQQLTFTGDRVLGASYAPSADLLIAGADLGGNERTQLYRLSPDGATFAPLTAQPEVIYQFGGWQEDGTHSSGWSPDGTRITYSSNERDPRFFDVYERPIAGGDPRLLLRHDSTNYSAGYAPDGRAVLVQRQRSNVSNQLLLVDVRSGEVRALTPASDERPALHSAAQWSADGQGLYLLSNRGRQFMALVWLNLATGELTYLRDEPWDAEGLALSRDGQRLALTTNEDGYSRLELFDIAQGWERRQPLPVPTLPRGVVFGLEWSPDGTQLAFTLDRADDARQRRHGQRLAPLPPLSDVKELQP